MNNNLLIVLGFLAVVVVVFFLFAQSPQTPSQTASPTSVGITESENSANLVLNEQNASGETGLAMIVEENGKVLVKLEMTGAPSNVTQPAHIHTGTCANIGGVVYPLESPVNGVTETTLNTTLAELASQLPLALNVHKSAQQSGVYVSCGDLAL